MEAQSGRCRLAPLASRAAQRSELVRLDQPHFLDRVRSRFGLADARAAVADGEAPLVHDPMRALPPDLAHPGPTSG